MQHLDLPDGPWTLAYMRIVRALRDDPTLRAVMHPDGWRTFTDEDNNDTPPSTDTLPSLQVLPHALKGTAEAPTSQYSPLGIGIMTMTSGTDVRDLLNLWWVVHRVIFPGDGSRDLVTAIRSDFVASETGAQLEAIQLGLPAITPSPPDLANQILVASGTLILVMRVRK